MKRTITAADRREFSQLFIDGPQQDRSFPTEEIAKFFGVPRSLFGSGESTKWGTGVIDALKAWQQLSTQPKR